MAKLSSLMDYYYESIYPEVQALEEKRLGIISYLKNTAKFLGIGSLILSILISRAMEVSFLKTAGIFFVIATIIFLLLYSSAKSSYLLVFQNNLIEKIIHF